MLSSLGLSVIDSVIDSANESDCDMLLKKLKRRRSEVKEQRYVFICSSSSHAMHNLNRDSVFRYLTCPIHSLPDVIYSVLMKKIYQALEQTQGKRYYYSDYYCSDYIFIFQAISKLKLFKNVQGPASEHLRKFDEYYNSYMNDDNNYGPDEYWDDVFHKPYILFYEKYGLAFLGEIHESVGLPAVLNGLVVSNYMTVTLCKCSNSLFNFTQHYLLSYMEQFV